MRFNASTSTSASRFNSTRLATTRCRGTSPSLSSSSGFVTPKRLGGGPATTNAPGRPMEKVSGADPDPKPREGDEQVGFLELIPGLRSVTSNPDLTRMAQWLRHFDAEFYRTHTHGGGGEADLLGLDVPALYQHFVETGWQ